MTIALALIFALLPLPMPFTGCPTPTGASATLLIPPQPDLSLPAGPVELGDVVAVYTGNAACVGTGTWTGAGLAVSIWADDPYTEAVDGFEPGDALQLRVFDASTATVYAGIDVGVAFQPGYGVGAGLASDGVYIIAESVAPPPLAVLWISEVDAFTDSTGAFVEIQVDRPNAILPAATLAAFGPSGAIYGTLDLSGLQADAAGLLVIRPEGAAAPGVSFPGVAAFETSAGAFALYAGPVPSDRTSALLDAVVYGQPGAGRAQALLDTLGRTVQYVDPPDASAGRAGPGGARLFYTAAPSPGAVNAATVSVAAHDSDDAMAGFRLVSVPVLSPSGSPLTVADLAGMNPVRGVPGAPSPEAPPNLWTGFDEAAGQFVAPASAETTVGPGHGLLWYWNGPAESTESFVRSQTGVPVDDGAGDGPYTWEVGAAATAGHYLVGNPYAYPLHLAGVLVGGATLQTAFAAWDPAGGTYVDLFSDLDGQDVLPVWAGALAEVSDAASSTFTVSTSSAFVDPLATGPPAGPASMVSFEVLGVLAGGRSVTDRSAHVRFVDGAEAGWDIHDATKLPSPAADYALLAPVGTRDGAARRQRVLSLPPEATATVPLAFTATQAGAFVVHWTIPELPAGHTAELADLVTGARVDLATAEEYAFAVAEATPWTDRFELRLASAPTTAEPVAAAEPFVGEPYPNPSAGTARIAVYTATPQTVSVDVFDMVGRRVAQPFSGPMAPVRGSDLAVDLRGLAPGLYVVRVVGETFTETRRVTVVR